MTDLCVTRAFRSGLHVKTYLYKPQKTSGAIELKEIYKNNQNQNMTLTSSFSMTKK